MRAELAGKVIEIHSPWYFGGFTKQVIWVQPECNGAEQVTWEIEFWNHDIQHTAGLSIGDIVKAHVLVLGKIVDMPRAQKVVNFYRCINIIKYAPGS